MNRLTRDYLARSPARVPNGLGLPAKDLSRSDPTARAAAGNTDGAAVYAGQAKVHDIVKQVAALAAGSPALPSRAAPWGGVNGANPARSAMRVNRLSERPAK